MAEAEAVWRDAVALAPQRSELRYGLAEVLRHRGSHAAAKALYRDILTQLPQHPGARFHLAALEDDAPPPAMPPALVQSFFDGYARVYDRHLRERLDYRGPERLRALLDQVCRPPTRAWSVLDLGCGTGLSGRAFRDIARSLVGVDLSAEMIARARGRALYDRLVVGDMVEALWREGTDLDLTVAVFISDYIGDLRPLFEAVAANLRTGGRFALTVQEGDGAADYVLRPNGRYFHGPDYVERIAPTTGLRVERRSTEVTREQDGQALESLLYLLCRDGG